MYEFGQIRAPSALTHFVAPPAERHALVLFRQVLQVVRRGELLGVEVVGPVAGVALVCVCDGRAGV